MYKESIFIIVPSFSFSNDNVQLLKKTSKVLDDNAYYTKMNRKIQLGALKSLKIGNFTLWNPVFCYRGNNTLYRTDVTKENIWNESWGSLIAKSSALIRSVVIKKTLMKTVQLNVSAASNIEVAERKNDMKGNACALSGSRRTRDSRIDHSMHNPKGNINTFNLREEVVCTVENAYDHELSPVDVSNAWNATKTALSETNIGLEGSKQIMTEIAATFLKDPSFRYKELDGVALQLEQIELDIDQAASTFTISVNQDEKFNVEDDKKVLELLTRFALLISDDVFLKDTGYFSANKITLNRTALNRNDKGLFGKGVTHMSSTEKAKFTGLTTDRSFSSPFKLSVRMIHTPAKLEKEDIEILKDNIWKISLVVAEFLKTSEKYGSIYQDDEFHLVVTESEQNFLLMDVYWGPLHSFLTLLLLAYSSEHDVVTAIETYNTKHGLKTRVDVGWLYSESGDNFVMPQNHSEVFKTLASSIYDSNKNSSAFVIWRFADLLKKERLTKNAKFRWGWGSTFYKTGSLIGFSNLFIPNSLKRLRKQFTKDTFMPVRLDEEMPHSHDDDDDDPKVDDDGSEEDEQDIDQNLEKKKVMKAFRQSRHKNDPVLNNIKNVMFFPPDVVFPIEATPCKFRKNDKVDYDDSVKSMSGVLVSGQSYHVSARF